jgi:hypothetical protein
MDAYVEALAAQVHEGWMATKRGQGVTSRLSETGEEQMVPYDQLSEAAKDLDRGTVQAVLEAQKYLCHACSAQHPLECDRTCFTNH